MDDADTPAIQRVLIADDHPLYCDALRVVVSQACPGAEIREAPTQEDVIAAVRGADPFDLVLLDLHLPGATGLSCLAAIRAETPSVPVVVVSAVDDPRILQDVVAGGANAFVPKSAPRQVLVNALKVILAGGSYIPAEVVAAMRNAQSDPLAELTLRQKRVLELLSSGQSNKSIARALGISEITAKAHVSAILRKLGVANRAQAGLEGRRLLGKDGY
jgi:DNA-binding NarL/FixJ family response regulator